MSTELKKRKPSEYRSNLKPIWCPGCGDFGVVSALYRALAALDIDPHMTAIMSGIGCSSRLPGYVTSYGFNTIHGRVLPISTGLKLMRPEITVVAVGGDGDGFSIGAGHIPHCARRNVDFTYLVMDNGIYGLTKGQPSPTSPMGIKTPSSVYGSVETPLNPLAMMLTYNTSFVAQAYSNDISGLANIIQEAIRHPGFSFINCLSPCPTFRGLEQATDIKSNIVHIDESHDPSDKKKAYELALRDDDNVYLGILYQQARPTYHDYQKELQEKAASKDIPDKVEDLIKTFIP